jgi:O-antigen/teichoic acid export membrane protein
MIPVPFLAAVYGKEAAGSFALMQRVVAVPMSLVGANVADAFHARLAVMVRETPARCPGLFRKTFALLAALGAVPAVVLLLWGRPLFLLVFGKEWGVAGEMATLVVPWIWLQLAVGPLSRLVFVLGGQAPKLIYDLVAFLSVSAVLVAARRFAWPLLETVRAISWANAAAYLLYLALLAWITARWVRRSGAAGRA